MHGNASNLEYFTFLTPTLPSGALILPFSTNLLGGLADSDPNGIRVGGWERHSFGRWRTGSGMALSTMLVIAQPGCGRPLASRPVQFPVNSQSVFKLVVENLDSVRHTKTDFVEGENSDRYSPENRAKAGRVLSSPPGWEGNGWAVGLGSFRQGVSVPLPDRIDAVQQDLRARPDRCRAFPPTTRC